jgi:hypothetical protein
VAVFVEGSSERIRPTVVAYRPCSRSRVLAFAKGVSSYELSRDGCCGWREVYACDFAGDFKGGVGFGGESAKRVELSLAGGWCCVFDWRKDRWGILRDGSRYRREGMALRRSHAVRADNRHRHRHVIVSWVCTRQNGFPFRSGTR